MYLSASFAVVIIIAIENVFVKWIYDQITRENISMPVHKLTDYEFYFVIFIEALWFSFNICEYFKIKLRRKEIEKNFGQPLK